MILSGSTTIKMGGAVVDRAPKIVLSGVIIAARVKITYPFCFSYGRSSALQLRLRNLAMCYSHRLEYAQKSRATWVYYFHVSALGVG